MLNQSAMLNQQVKDERCAACESQDRAVGDGSLKPPPDQAPIEGTPSASTDGSGASGCLLDEAPSLQIGHELHDVRGSIPVSDSIGFHQEGSSLIK